MNKSIIIIAVAGAVAASSILYAASWNADNEGGIPSIPSLVVETTDSKTDTPVEAHSIGSIVESLNGAELGKFTAFSEYAEFLDELGELGDRDEQLSRFGEFLNHQAESVRFQATASQALPDAHTHSTTNVQVQGVDEADFVKNDGRYIYALKHNILSIVDTQMITESSAFVTALDIPPLVQNYNMLVNGDRLVVLYGIIHYSQVGKVQDYTTHALVLDITDKSAVEKVMEYSVGGQIYTGRMIGDHVYTVSSKMPNAESPAEPVLRLDDEIIQHTPIYFLDHIKLPTLTTIMAFDVNGGSSNSLSIVMDYTGIVFMSKDNMYIASFKDDPDTTVSPNLVLKLLEPILESYPDHVRSELVAELQEIDLYRPA